MQSRMVVQLRLTHCAASAPAAWIPFGGVRCRVKGRVDGKIVPIPPSQETINTLFDANVKTEEEMEARRRAQGTAWHILADSCAAQAWLAARRVVNPTPKDGEEAALSRAVRGRAVCACLPGCSVRAP